MTAIHQGRNGELPLEKALGLKYVQREVKPICFHSLGCLTGFKLIAPQAFCCPSIDSDLPDKAVPKSGGHYKKQACILLLLLC